MKLLYLSLLLSFSTLYCSAQQSNLIVFSENGERFQVVLNGIQYNQEAETNVKITELNGVAFKLRILFEDSVNGVLDKTLYLEPNTETTVNIKQNKKGKFVARPFGQVPLAQAAAPAPQQTVYAFGVATPIHSNVIISSGTQIHMGNDMAVPGSNGEAIIVGSNTCPQPMDDYMFNDALQSIKSKSFEDSKVEISKQVINANCLTSIQVAQVLNSFSFEDSKIAVAKQAYLRVYDPQNYYQVNDVFDFESSIEELGVFVNNNKRNPSTQIIHSEAPIVEEQVTIVEEVTTTTTTHGGNTGNGDQINVNFNMNGSGIGVNMEINDDLGGFQETHTTTTTTTTISGSSPAPIGEEIYISESDRCAFAMNDYEFQDALNSIESKSFADSKMTVAKQIASANCLSSKQIKSIMTSFDFEDNRLEFAKYAYTYCFDPQNYYQVNDAFDFDSSIEELNRSIGR